MPLPVTPSLSSRPVLPDPLPTIELRPLTSYQNNVNPADSPTGEGSSTRLRRRSGSDTNAELGFERSYKDYTLPHNDEESDTADSESSEIYMNRRNRASKATDPAAETPPEEEHQNGHMNTTALEHRRRYSVTDGSMASQVQHLMKREDFSLDNEPTLSSPIEEQHAQASGFWDLPEKDRKNFMLLVLLYFLQGIPMGLAGGSVPFLLKSHLSYGQIGVFSLASYPYSLKLLWSPIVDAVWSRRVGRRKSWILPVQMFSGFGMIWLGSRVEAMMVAAGADSGAGVWGFTWWWFFLVFTCATQDIAVDGMSLSCAIPSTKSPHCSSQH